MTQIDPADLKREVDRIVAGSITVSPDQKLAYYKREVAALPAGMREPVELFLLAVVEGLGQARPAHWTEITLAVASIFVFLVGAWGLIVVSERTGLSIMGAGLIMVLVLVAILVKNPSPFQQLVFRIVLALVAAVVAWAVGGVIEIQMDLPQGVLKATGAVAVFVIVYLLNPRMLKGTWLVILVGP